MRRSIASEKSAWPIFARHPKPGASASFVWFSSQILSALADSRVKGDAEGSIPTRRSARKHDARRHGGGRGKNENANLSVGALAAPQGVDVPT
jgi:hypothetical protein